MRLAKMAVSVAWYVVSALFAFFVYLYNANRTFRFHCKVVLYYLIIIFICAVTVPLSLPWPGDAGNVDTGARIMQFVSKIFGIKWHVKGEENVPDGACVVVANHQSGLDVMGMMEVWPQLRRCVSMVKKELRYAGPFGILAMLSGSIFIDRVNSDKARQTINDAVDYLKEKQIKIYNKQLSLFQPGEVTVTILPTISTTGLGPQDVSELSESVRSEMLRVFEATSEKATNGQGSCGKKTQ